MHTLARRIGAVLWPAFLGAAALEMAVFAFVDPAGLRAPSGGAPEWSPIAVYSLAFFAFWLIAGGACWLTLTLALGHRRTAPDAGASDALSDSRR